MDASERRDPITGVVVDQPDLPVYMPGTPTVSFTAYAERILAAVFR